MADGQAAPDALFVDAAPADALQGDADFDGQGGAADTVFTMLSQTGFDHSVPDTPQAQGLEVDRRYLDASGNAVTEAMLGDELTVQLRIRSTGKPRSNVAVVDLLPGGFEVLADSLRRQQNGWSPDYYDVREDDRAKDVEDLPEGCLKWLNAALSTSNSATVWQRDR